MRKRIPVKYKFQIHNYFNKDIIISMQLKFFAIALLLLISNFASSQSPLDIIRGQVDGSGSSSSGSGSTGSGSLASKTSVRCSTSRCRVHWVFALDESGSMFGEQWTKARNLLQDISDLLELYTGQQMTVYTFDTRATLPPAKYADFINPSSWSSGALNINGGGTSFGQPLVRGLEFILLHRDSNTCFVMITDGQANYPAIEIKIFQQVAKFMQDRGYSICVICYFITGPAQASIPSSYQRTCQDLKGTLAIGARSQGPAVRAFGVQSIETNLLDDFVNQSANFIRQVS